MTGRAHAETIRNALFESRLPTSRHYVDFGYATLKAGDMALARQIMRTARWLLPQNPGVIRRAAALLVTSTIADLSEFRAAGQWIFELGLSRTGKNSPHHILSALGLRPAHWLNKEGQIANLADSLRFEDRPGKLLQLISPIHRWPTAKK